MKGHTALHHAAKKGHVEVVRLLLAAGADRNASEKCESTALIEASTGGHLATVRVLLSETGRATDFAGQRGRTALLWASIHGHAEAQNCRANPKLGFQGIFV